MKKITKRIYLLLFNFFISVCLAHVSTSFCTQQPIDTLLGDQNKVEELEVLRVGFLQGSYIVFLQDVQQNRFVLKQRKDDRFVLREALGAWVAEGAGVPANITRIVPPDLFIPGKLYADRAASLHTFVPGKPDKKIDLRQGFRAKTWGFTKRIIRIMSLHDGLPAIVALDTFIGNRDRNADNLFYDKESDAFFCFDFGVAFTKAELADLACQLISKMIEAAVHLTEKETVGLIKFRDVLKKLVAHFTPERVHEKIDELSEQVPTVTAEEKETYKKNFAESYGASKKLLSLLDVFIAG